MTDFKSVMNLTNSSENITFSYIAVNTSSKNVIFHFQNYSFFENILSRLALYVGHNHAEDLRRRKYVF